MRSWRLLPLVSALLLALPGCDRAGEDTAPPEADAAPQDDEDPMDPDHCHTGDPADEWLHQVIAAMDHEDKSELASIADGPLLHDLTDEAFADLSHVIVQLGTFKACEPINEGRYMLTFTRGEVEARLTVENDKVHGIYFGGDAFAEAEHAILGDAELVFKVYGFEYVDEEGHPNPGGNVFAPGRQHFLITVGGFEAREGEHHVTVTKKVYDAEGNVVYESPDEIDITFTSNLEGVRTALVLKYVDIEKPGKYSMELTLVDQLTGSKVVREGDFEVKAGG